MRILKPEVAKERKEKILNWLIYRYITTGNPVSSGEIFENGNFSISPASIRNILKELDDEGFLEQVHTSGGRIPTDKAYRLYIDNILKAQNIAEAEKEKIEIEYDRRIAELDYFLKHTTKILSDLTRKVGFSIVSDISNEHIKRIDIVQVSDRGYILIIVTVTGIIKHYPFVVSKSSEKISVKTAISKLNKSMKDLSIREAKDRLLKDFLPKDEGGIFHAVYDIFLAILKEEDELFIDGITRMYEETDEFSLEDIRMISKLLEEKERFTKILKERFMEAMSSRKEISSGSSENRRVIDVRIGSENKIKELDNFSMVTSSYCLKDKSYGLIGIIGHRRMEYPKIISIVDAIGSMIEDVLKEWDKECDF
ncbi:MAG: heat-inducible transcriptional repressor HrcA [Elusimicrobiota bacterium]